MHTSSYIDSIETFFIKIKRRNGIVSCRILGRKDFTEPRQLYGQTINVKRKKTNSTDA